MMCRSLEMIKKQTLDSSCFWYFWLSTEWIPSAKTDQFFCWGTAMGKILTSHHANRLKLKLQSRPRPTQQLGSFGGVDLKLWFFREPSPEKPHGGKRKTIFQKCQAGGVEWKMFPFLESSILQIAGKMTKTIFRLWPE